MHNKLIRSLILAAVLLAGCEQQMNDLDAFIIQVESAPPSAIEPYPAFSTQPAFKYKASNLRSPFQRSHNSRQTVRLAQMPNCQQPDVERAKMTLENYGIDALSIQGFFTTSQRTFAIIAANDGTLHKITVGDRLGLFHGRVTSITPDTLYYTELIPDGTGCWKQKQSKLTVNKDSGEEPHV